jgi:hypothetical protein
MTRVFSVCRCPQTLISHGSLDFRTYGSVDGRAVPAAANFPAAGLFCAFLFDPLVSRGVSRGLQLSVQTVEDSLQSKLEIIRGCSAALGASPQMSAQVRELLSNFARLAKTVSNECFCITAAAPHGSSECRFASVPRALPTTKVLTVIVACSAAIPENPAAS